MELSGLVWTVQAVQAIASTISDVIGAPDGVTVQPTSTDAKLQGSAAAVPASAAGNNPAVHVTDEETDYFACMAADWLSLLARGPEGTGACQAAIAGLATAVILCCSTRCCPSLHLHRNTLPPDYSLHLPCAFHKPLLACDRVRNVI